MHRPQRKQYRVPEYKNTGLSEKAVDFFTQRKISLDAVRRNRISSGRGKIFFPYLEGGEVKNIKTRFPRKKFQLEQDAELLPYGMDDVAEETIWVEGEMDKLAIETAGFRNCVASPSALPPNTKNYNLRYLDDRDFSTVKKFILAGDSDAPGKRLTRELSRRLGVERCYIAEWPEDCKDANDVLVKYGPEKIKECLNDAYPVPVEGVYRPNDYFPTVENVYRQGLLKGVTTGFPSLDPHFTLMGGQWTVTTGAPGSGKSQIIDCFMVQTAQLHGWRWGICSMENQPVWLHIIKLVEIHNGMPFFEGYNRRLSIDDLRVSNNFLQDHVRFILPGDDLSVDNVLKLAAVEVRRFGINGLVIDPWNELDHDYQKGESETQYISHALTRIRRFAREYNVHVFVVAHPTKLKRGDDGSYPVATGYDIAGSANWFNKADNIISCWRDIRKQSPLVDIHVQKVRFQKQVGIPGMVTFKYDRVSSRYSEGNFEVLHNAF